MEYNHKHIMLPAVSEQRWALWTAAVASIPMGIFFLVIGLIQRGRLGETVEICFFGLMFILLGLGCLISALARMHLVPEGIAWALGKYALRQIPREEVKCFCIAAQYSKHGLVYRLGISCKDIADLARLRENQLLRNPYMRTTVPRIKASPGWQQKFAGEYIKKKAVWNLIGILGRHIIWNAYSPELQALLKMEYPEVETHIFLERYTPYGTKWVDRDPRRFCRGRAKETDKFGVTFLCMAIMVSPLLLILCVGETLLAALPLMLCFGLIIGLSWYFSRGEYDVVHLSEDSIRIMRGKREYSHISREQIRRIIHVNNGMESSSEGYLAVTALNPEQILDKEMTALSRTGNGRILLNAWQQATGWEQRLVARHCAKRISQWGLNSKDYLIMCCTPQRIQTLREMYPEVEWIDVAFGSICNNKTMT